MDVRVETFTEFAGGSGGLSCGKMAANEAASDQVGEAKRMRNPGGVPTVNITPSWPHRGQKESLETDGRLNLRFQKWRVSGLWSEMRFILN